MEKIILIRNVVKRKPDTLYYIDKEGNLCQAPMTRALGKGINKQRQKLKKEREELLRLIKELDEKRGGKL